MSKNHNLELTIDESGVLHLTHWDSRGGADGEDRYFQIYPNAELAFEEIYNPSDFESESYIYDDVRPDLISIDLISELAKMAKSWRERAKSDIAEEKEKNRKWHEDQLNTTCRKCIKESCHGCEIWKDGLDILIEDVNDENNRID